MRRGLFLLACLLFGGTAAAMELRGHALDEHGLRLDTDDGEVRLRFHGPMAIEAHYRPEGVRQLPSFSLTGEAAPVQASLREVDGGLVYGSGRFAVHVQARPLRLSYHLDGALLVEEEVGLFATETLRGFRFRLQPDEKLAGAGQRVLGMDRRGHRLPLHNRPHYGYGRESRQMYFSLPAVLSSRNYLLLFDNSASGHIDIGASNPDVLQFEAIAGRTGYVVVAGDHWPGVIEAYVGATGHPPLPARWTLGNYASRFGYRSRAEAEDVVRRFREADVPLDAIVLDLFWFGPDIQGHMGNLDWDREAFPDPEGMMAAFAADDVHTILVTEPFVLTTSTRWEEAVREGVLARDLAGAPRTFDFYFGNTGLVDVFDDGARRWFWSIYEGLTRQGVGGWWGDLGEPEVHPEDTVHALGMAGEVHNAYGHEWARLVHDGHVAAFPERRPFVMMRAGAPGSQRYGMVPWTGDVERSWDGLSSQVELALQMGLFGFGWIHSDLGGFAGGEAFDAELYTRWLQYGVFQPVFRPHAQEHIPPEPVFHDAATLALAREAVRLRYALLPYNYTLAWTHARTGLPPMRPLYFLDPGQPDLIDRTDAYLWGDAFLVAPVVEPGLSTLDLAVPEGVWFDFHDGRRIQGGTSHRFALSPDRIPVLVRAGAFVPMQAPAASTARMDGAPVTVHYWADATANRAGGQLYDDDGRTRGADRAGDHRVLDFRAEDDGRILTLWVVDRPGAGRPPAARDVALRIHGLDAAPAAVTVDGEAVELRFDPQGAVLDVPLGPGRDRRVEVHRR
ncbi:MAG: TIM-barrel domain-containing protein [Lysobacteraceae bacterium]